MAKEADKAKKIQSEELVIPKHRFDCVNLCLKDTKQSLKDAEAEVVKLRQIAGSLEHALIISQVDKYLAMAGARNIQAARALVDFSNLSLNQYGEVPEAEQKVAAVKAS